MSFYQTLLIIIAVWFTAIIIGYYIGRYIFGKRQIVLKGKEEVKTIEKKERVNIEEKDTIINVLFEKDDKLDISEIALLTMKFKDFKNMEYKNWVKKVNEDKDIKINIELEKLANLC